MAEEIEEAQIVTEETGVILKSEFTAPALPTVLDKDGSLELIKKARLKYESIKVDGTKDKANYKLVVGGIKELKDSRLAWIKSVKETVLTPADAWLKTLKEDIKEIEQAFKDGEEALRIEKDRIDTLKAEEAQAEENRKTALLATRVEILVGLGGKQSNNQYVFDYDMALFVTVAQMKESNDKQWEAIMKDIQKSYDAEQKRIEDVRLAQEAEQLKLQSQVADLNAERTEMRKEILEARGFEFEPVLEVYIKGETAITSSQVINLDATAWKEAITPVVKPEQSAIVDNVAAKEETPVEAPKSAMQPSQSFDEPKPTAKFVMPVIDDEPDQKKIDITINFTEEKSFISFNLGIFTQRIYPIEFAEIAMRDIDAEFIMSSGTIVGHEGLMFSSYKSH